MAWRKSKATEGGVLGLGGAMPPKDHVQPRDGATGTSGSGPTLRPEPEVVEGATGSLQQGKGATGIDMGAGGSGTDIKP